MLARPEGLGCEEGLEAELAGLTDGLQVEAIRERGVASGLQGRGQSTLVAVVGAGGPAS